MLFFSDQSLSIAEMTTTDARRAQVLARDYVNKRNIPELFEAMMTALMVEKPENHLEFLSQCIQRCEAHQGRIPWDMFITKKGGLFNALKPLARPTWNGTDASSSKQLCPIMFVVGGPGSDKSRISQLICDRYGYEHISVGQLLRDLATTEDESAERVKECLKTGDLVPTEIVYPLLRKEIREKIHSPTGLLIDGYPRTIAQAKQFKEDFGHCKFALFINLSREVLKKQLEERCEHSGRIDDNRENVDNRIRIFFNQTLSVLDYYEQQNVDIPEISLESSTDEIHQAGRLPSAADSN